MKRSTSGGFRSPYEKMRYDLDVNAGSSPALCTMIDVYDIIKQINERKKSARMEPSSALFSEISEEVSKEIKKEINELCKDGKLGFHRTINDFSFDAK